MSEQSRYRRNMRINRISTLNIDMLPILLKILRFKLPLNAKAAVSRKRIRDGAACCRLNPVRVAHNRTGSSRLHANGLLRLTEKVESQRYLNSDAGSAKSNPFVLVSGIGSC